MKNFQLEILKKVEDSIFQEKLSQKKKVYRKIDFYYINSFKYPFQCFFKLSEVSSIRKFPILDTRAWLIWFFSGIKVKKFQKKSLFNLLGVLPSWWFLDKAELDLTTNFIYSRGHSIVMIYPDHWNPCVIKVTIPTSPAKGASLKNSEIDSLKTANSIFHPVVSSPKFLEEAEGDNYSYFVQEFVSGSEITSVLPIKRRRIYDSVFEFMVEFYLHNGVELIQPELDDYFENPLILQFFQQRDYFIVIEKIQDLFESKKKMFYTMIHNDLYHKNILVNKGKIHVIDWGNSERNFLVRDFSNKKFNAKIVFNKILESFESNIEEIFNLQEQIFIEEFIDTCLLIEKYYKKKKPKMLHHRIVFRIKKLTKKVKKIQ